MSELPSATGRKGVFPPSKPTYVPTKEGDEKIDLGRRNFTRNAAIVGGTLVVGGGIFGLLKYLAGESEANVEGYNPDTKVSMAGGENALADPHLKAAFPGGYEVVGDMQGAGFKVDQKDNKIYPGGNAEIAGIIENGKGIVYMDEEIKFDAVYIIIHKGDFAVDQWNLQDAKDVQGIDGVLFAEIDLAELKDEYGLNVGDYIFVVPNSIRSKSEVLFMVQ